MYLALLDILNKKYEKLLIVRSAVACRDVGFLPGTLKEKTEVFEVPYVDICSTLFEKSDAYETLKKRNQIEFVTTSYIRGLTYSNCIIIFDEIQNCTFQEISSVVTRIGQNSKLICCGDFKQTDLDKKKNDKTGILEFLEIIDYMESVVCIDFTVEDIVRSGLVREFLIAQNEYEKFK